MTVNDEQDQRAVGRRSLLRGGAVLAGAGLAGTALAQPASATPVDYVRLASDNAETTTTGITVNGTTGDTAVPAVSLSNANGPSLFLQPLDVSWEGSLQVGQIANTTDGPLIGVHDPRDADSQSTTTSFLVTGIDLDLVPTPIAVPPTRLLDTRTPAGRKGILASSTDAFDADFRLRSGAWVDILVAPTESGFTLPSVFVNLTAVNAGGTGFVAIYPPGEYSGTSTLNVVKGQTVANAAFVAVRVVQHYYAVRILTTAACWLIVDLSGGVVQGFPYTQPAGRRAAGSRASIVRQMLAKVGRRN